MMPRTLLAVVLVVMCWGNVDAALVYYDGDQAGYEAATSGHVVVADEDFSGWVLGTVLHDQIPNCTFSGSAALTVQQGIHGPAWPVEFFADERGISNGDSLNSFVIDFAAPVAALGLMHYDEDPSAVVGVIVCLVGGAEFSTTMTPAGEMESPSGAGNPDGLFWGVVASEDSIVQVTIAHTYPSGDAWGFDDFTASASGAVPEPASAAIWSFTLLVLGMGWWRRRRTRTAF